MPEKRPSSALLIEAVVEQLEGLRAYHGSIIMRPARTHRIEQTKQVRLLGGFVLADQL
jgi:hypothetical protein